jgi:hypothetical protein
MLPDPTKPLIEWTLEEFDAAIRALQNAAGMGEEDAALFLMEN